MSEPALHPDVQPLRFLLGRWVGEGHGRYPTIPPFDYREELRFDSVGKPFLICAQRTWAADDGRPLATSTSYWRGQPQGRLEVVFAHPTGIAEIEEGTVAGTVVRLATVGVLCSATAKRVDRIERTLELVDGRLDCGMRMAAVGQPLQDHLTSRLERRR